MPKRSPAGCLPGRDRFSIDDPAERVGDTWIKNEPDPRIRARLFFLCARRRTFLTGESPESAR